MSESIYQSRSLSKVLHLSSWSSSSGGCGCLLSLALVLVEKISGSGMLVLLIDWNSSLILLLSKLRILRTYQLLMPFNFLLHSYFVASYFVLEFVILCLYLQFEVFLRLLIVIEEIKILNQQLTPTSCLLLLLL